MTLKGEWSSVASYDASDVARYSNGTIYGCVKANTGAPCADALYWNPLSSPLQECAKMILDMVAGIEANIPTNIDDESIVLKSGDNEYLVSVDASGDDPEVVATLIEEEGD